MVQDTTSLNYSYQEADSGLGSWVIVRIRLWELWLHTTLAVDDSVTALGLMQAQMWTGDPAQAGIAARRKKRALMEKKS